MRKDALCSWICEEKSWYEFFFKNSNGDLRSEFIELYVFYLKKFSSENFLKNFLKLNKQDIKLFNSAVYGEKSKFDKVFYRGLAPYIYDENYLYERAKLIRNKIKSSNFNN